MKLADYADTFADFSPYGWSARRLGKIWSVTMPNGFEYQFDPSADERVDWFEVFSFNHVTTRLWHRSLVYLRNVAREADGWEAVGWFLGQFEELIHEAESDANRLGMNSLDHALALELRTLCELRSLAERERRSGPGSAPDAVERVIARVERLVPSLLHHARSDGMLQRHNHGMMLVLALAHVALVFPGSSDAEVLRQDAIWLNECLVEVSGSDGVVSENTPAYQKLYIDICEQAVEVFRLLPWELAETTEMADIALRLRTAYGHMLTPGGLVPSIGDAPQSRERAIAPVLGSFHSERNGYFVLNEAGAQLAFTCGAAGPIHKQMDDSAVRLYVDETPLILDAGLLTYDAHDLEAAGVRAQPGHSGVFYPSLDKHPSFWFYPAAGPRRVDAAMLVVDGPRDTENVEASARQHREVLARYIVDGVFEARRSLEVRSPLDFTVRDWAKGPDGEAAVQRWLLPRSLAVSWNEGNDVVAENAAFRMVFSAPRSRWSLRTVAIGVVPRTRDFAWCLERRLQQGAESETHVRVLRLESGMESS